MKSAQFEYKCRRCGALYRNPDCDRKLARRILVEITIAGFGSDDDGNRVFLHDRHSCNDGGEGIADLLGYRKFEGHEHV